MRTDMIRVSETKWKYHGKPEDLRKSECSFYVHKQQWTEEVDLIWRIICPCLKENKDRYQALAVWTNLPKEAKDAIVTLAILSMNDQTRKLQIAMDLLNIAKGLQNE